MESSEDVGMCASQVRLAGEGLLDSVGMLIASDGSSKQRGHAESPEAYSLPEEVLLPSGSAALYRRRMMEELGGFDEDFFASHEDVDLSYRARLRGYRCRYVASATVRHRGSATLGRTSATAVFHGQRNLEWMYLKNTPGGLLARTFAGHVLYNLAAAAYFARAGLLGTFVRAKVAAAADLPRILRKRAAVQSSRRVGGAGIWPHLDAGWLSTKLREKRFDTTLAGDAR
jgi:GT2 family glycosyltransferase